MEMPGYRRATVADIPGLIEGAHRGVGLGYEFLRHITRCPILVFVIDVAGSEGRNPVEDLQNLRREVDLYDPALSSRQWLVVANKMDLPDAERNLRALQERFPQTKIIPTSAAKGQGVAELKKTLAATMPNDKDVLSGAI
jgi:GTP-binding protein